MQVVLFCTTIGRDPAYLHLAIVNDELKDYQSCDTFHAPPDQCNMSLLSCQYLHDLSNRTSYIQDIYTNVEDAKYAVKRGKAWGVIHFNSNYTSSLVERIDLGNQAPEDIVSQADIGINFDMSSTFIQSIPKKRNTYSLITDQAIGHLMARDVTYTFLHFIRKVLSLCEWNPRVVDIPIAFHTPIYGDSEPRFLDFTSPGSILA